MAQVVRLLLEAGADTEKARLASEKFRTLQDIWEPEGLRKVSWAVDDINPAWRLDKSPRKSGSTACIP